MLICHCPLITLDCISPDRFFSLLNFLTVPHQRFKFIIKKIVALYYPTFENVHFFISYIKQLPGPRRNYIKDKQNNNNNNKKPNKNPQNKTQFPVFVLCNKSCWHKHCLNSVTCSISYNCCFSLFSLTSFTLTIQSAILNYLCSCYSVLELPKDTRTAHKLQQAFRFYKLLKAPERVPDTSETTNSKGS